MFGSGSNGLLLKMSSWMLER